jgi:fatty acid desaturase
VSLRDSVGAFAVVWLEIAVLLAGVHFARRLPLALLVPVAIVLVLLIATRINALNVLMHEASHGFLAPTRRTNDRLCNAGAAWWMLHSVEEYRPAHRLHHRYLNTAKDPDLDSYLIPEGRWALARMIAADLVGLTALRRAGTLLAASDAQENTRSSAQRRNLAGKAMAQLVMLGCFIAFAGIVPCSR